MMNKQLTKKLIGIAASAALIGTVAFSGSAIAGKGPQASAGVSTWCEIKPEDEAAGIVTVHVTPIDKSSGEAFGYVNVATAVVKGLTKERGNRSQFVDIAGAQATPDLMMNVENQEVTLNICGGPILKSINAKTTITLDSPYPSSKAEYTAYCSDNPYTEETEGGLKTADYPDLCTAP